MSKKQFTLDSWLKDKSQKVVTRCGFPVRIVCTDVKRKDYPILALVEKDDQEEYQSFTKDGRFSLNFSHDIFDLFIETADEVSEDEKIRKSLITFFQRFPYTNLYDAGLNAKEVIAWLEKQESVGEIVERCKDSWYNEGKIAGMAEGLTDDEKYQQGWHDALEKQSKQKSIKENKEYKTGLDEALWAIEQAKTIAKDENDMGNLWYAEHWLKSLKTPSKYAYNPYKAVVESIAEMCKHYDKASHNGLRDFYDNVKVKCKDAKEYDKIFPQAQWKPSNEQMEALNWQVENTSVGSWQYKATKELFGDLKKLKEE